MNEIKQLNETMEKHDAYSRALTWDKKLMENDSIEWLLGTMFAGYQDNELMILGIVSKNYFKENTSSVSIFKNPNLNDEILDKEVLDNILKFSKESMGLENAHIEVRTTKKENTNKGVIKSLKMNKKKGV